MIGDGDQFAVRNASAVEPEVVMLASARVPESGTALACAREPLVSPDVEVGSYAGSLQLLQASLLGQELRLVAAE